LPDVGPTRAEGSSTARADLILARLDRLPAWGLSYGLVWALGFSWFVTLYDAVGNVGPALPQMIGQGFFPGNLATAAGLTQATNEALLGGVTLVLLGYPVGAIALSYLADRVGRRPVMITSIVLTGVGELILAVSPNYVIWDVFRFVVGCGIGADLALVITYLSEMSPAAKRGTYVNNTYIAGWIGVGFGALLATEIVTHDAITGWRVAFGVAAVLAFFALALRSTAPESVRYLVKRGKFEHAERLVSDMEQRAMKRARVTSLPEPEPLSFALTDQNPFRALAKPTYIKRLLVLFAFWFFLYWVQYPYSLAFDTYFPQVFGYTASESTVVITIAGFAALGATAGAILVRPLLNRVDRRALATVSAAFWAIGLFIAFQSGPPRNYVELIIGLLLLNGIGGGFTYQLMYLVSAESFPTASRGTGYSLTDGLGHLGGAISPAILLPLTLLVGPAYAFPILGIPVIIVGLVVILLLPRTVGKRLEEVNESLVTETKLPMPTTRSTFGEAEKTTGGAPPTTSPPP
jgi:putative MFS transporter